MLPGGVIALTLLLGAAFTAFFGQLGLLSLLTLRLTRQIRRAGASETKALLAASRS
ncbi:hypothetical protein [Stenomitos frigidus]|uniref:hypothetical protein n=1 Tax=Stenomitos frigidus TaxID=1886765 RepID=UPI0015E70E53|nr:hypothetical protein [Stenomitos frigidus]